MSLRTRYIMKGEPANNNVEQFVEFTLFLDSIDNLDPSLNFPLRFNVYVELHDHLLNVSDVIITVTESVGTIGLEVPLNVLFDEVSEFSNFASHPLLIYFELLNEIEKNTQESDRINNDNAGIKQTWVCVVDLLPLAYDRVETSRSPGVTVTTQSAAAARHSAAAARHSAAGGRYPMRSIGGLDRDLSSNAAAWLNATVSSPETSSFCASPPPKNVLDIAVHGLYVPSGDHHRHHRQAATTCSAEFHFPNAVDRIFGGAVFAGGTYTDVTRDGNELRWYSLDNMPTTVSATGQSFEEYDGIVVNSAEISEPKDVLFKGPRYEWNLRQRFVVDEQSSQTFQDFIFKHRYLPVSFKFNPMVTNNALLPPSHGHNDTSNNDRGMVYVALLDLSMLLVLNCTSIRCLSIVHTLVPKDVSKNDAMSLITLHSRLDVNEFVKTNAKDIKSKESTVPSSALDVTFNSDSVVQLTTGRRSPFAVIDVSVARSFYDQYLEYLVTSLSGLNVISRRAQGPTTFCAVSPTSNKFRETLKNITETLLKTTERIDNENGVESYLNELKATGTYELMQSLLCSEIQMYIKNYCCPLIGETLQSFVNRIFVNLVDEMKETVDLTPLDCPHFGFKNMTGSRAAFTAVCAREADELKRLDRAKTFYLDIISAADPRCNPNYWLLYGSFCSRRLDFDTALECVREVLLVDGGSRIGLFSYAAIQLTIHGENDDDSGEIALKSLAMSHSDFSEAYALLGVHYLMREMHEASFIALQRAADYVKNDQVDTNHIIRENLMSWQPIGHNNDPLIKCAILLLELEMVKLASHCLNLVKNQCEEYVYYMAVCNYKNENYLKSLEFLKAIKMTKKYKIPADALECLNRLGLIATGAADVSETEAVIRGVVYAEGPRDELRLVYSRAAEYFYGRRSYAEAVEICRIACAVSRTPATLTVLAKCLIQMGEVETAENVLNEANAMDVRDEEVWAYLTVVNIEMGNIKVAKICYQEALKNEFKPEMEKEINTLFGQKINTIMSFMI